VGLLLLLLFLLTTHALRVTIARHCYQSVNQFFALDSLLPLFAEVTVIPWATQREETVRSILASLP
jgi:hypothetical protein